MFWETLDDHRIELLKKIVNKVDIISSIRIKKICRF